jgi:hypothetical protein
MDHHGGRGLLATVTGIVGASRCTSKNKRDYDAGAERRQAAIAVHWKGFPGVLLCRFEFRGTRPVLKEEFSRRRLGIFPVDAGNEKKPGARRRRDGALQVAHATIRRLGANCPQRQTFKT